MILKFKLSSGVLGVSFKTYCMSLFGSVLWDLTDVNVNRFYITYIQSVSVHSVHFQPAVISASSLGVGFPVTVLVGQTVTVGQGNVVVQGNVRDFYQTPTE